MLSYTHSTSNSRVTASVGDTSAMDVEFPDDVMLAAGDAAMERLSQQEKNSQNGKNIPKWALSFEIT